MHIIQHYQKYVASDEGLDVYMHWLEKLKDTTAKIAIVRRVARMEIGNFGDHKFCRNGVWELRIDVGAGYRVYDAIVGKRLFCCCAAATNERRMQTLIVPVNTGATGRLERGQRGQAS